MIPKDYPWPDVYSGVDARKPWPVEGVSLAASSWPFLWKARYSDDAEEWGAGSIDQYLEDGVGYARAAWDAVRPGGWMALNLGDSRLNTGGSGGQVTKTGQRVYRQDRSHGIEGQQWAMIPERSALAVREQTGWQLTGKVTWKKPTPVLADCSQFHLRRNRRPGLQHEMIYLFWKPGGRQVFNADVLVYHVDPVSAQADAYLRRVRDVLAGLPVKERRRLVELGVVPSGDERNAIGRLASPGVRGVLGDVWDLPKHTSAPPWAAREDDTKAWPDELCERLVLLLTDPDELVVDPCAGYGSLLRAAGFHGRRGWGADLYAGRTPLPG